jgi:hypothetical protein
VDLPGTCVSRPLSAFFRLLTEAQISAGIVAYYEDFLGLLSEAFGGRVKITCIGHIGHTEKDWQRGRLSSLQASQRHGTSPRTKASWTS